MPLLYQLLSYFFFGDELAALILFPSFGFNWEQWLILDEMRMCGVKPQTEAKRSEFFHHKNGKQICKRIIASL